MGDDTQIELAVLNLAINARDAMPEGGILTITTRAYRAAIGGDLAPGDYVELAVMDTGTGMPPEVAARAFDPFFTTKGVGKGTGLGLSQVYGMARQAGGIARVQSQPGHGSTVSMFLPRTEAAVQPDAEHTSAPAEPRSASATILVIDDDPDVRRFLADTLDSLGFAVVQAEDGATGLAALARHPPDLVILDYAMPGMTGAEVAQTVRAHSKELPILFATGYADTKALDSVAEDAMVLRKPFGVDELQRAVRGALGR
jgi:CheY-like chemotaxis protein